MKNRILIFLAFANFCTLAQENLILNPGMEGDKSDVYRKKSINIFENGRDTVNLFFGACDAGDLLGPYWWQPTKGTTDYLRWDSLVSPSVGKYLPNGDYMNYYDGWWWPAQGTNERKLWERIAVTDQEHFYEGVPRKYKPRTGKGSMGAYLYSTDGLCEYMQTKLKTSLIAGKSYYFECYIKRSDGCSYQTGNIGVYFSNDSIRSSGNKTFNLKPQLEFCHPDDLNSSIDWKKISGHYVASGGELFLTIGSFEPCASRMARKNQVKKDNEKTYFNGDKGYQQVAYYYFDDFLLTGDTVLNTAHYQNLVLLVDISKSMYKGNYIQPLKDTLRNFIREYGKYSRITLVTFGTKTKVVLRSYQITDEKKTEELLNNFDTESATLIDPAIIKAYSIADSAYSNSGDNRIYLFSDGAFDLDKQTKRIIQAHTITKPILFTFVQFGTKKNSELEKIINENKGKYVLSNEFKIHEELKPRNTLNKECNCSD